MIPAPDDVAWPPLDAQTTASGLAIKVLKAADGPQPGPYDHVTVHYTGWTTDGEMFDSSKLRGQPATFPLNRVIKGWTEGLQLMNVGSTARLWIPAELAYGNTPGRPQGMLVFDVELLSLKEGPKPPQTPSDVAEPPADAQKTPSGLRYKALTPAEGEARPHGRSTVTVHYSGWTTDGQLFDSSRLRGEPATFPLDRVIPGWTEGLQLMTKGQQMRLWIPVHLAYNNAPGAPKGMLVFDVELLSFR